MQNENINKFENNLIELFYQLIKNDENELKEFIKEEDINIEKLNRRNEDFIKKLQTKTKIEISKKAQEEKKGLFFEAIEIFKSLGEDVKNILSPTDYKKLNVQFRNVETINDNEVEELLKDKAIIKLMEKIVNKRKKGNE